MDFLKTIVGKVIGGLVALGVIAGAITIWAMDSVGRQAVFNDTGKVLVWFGVVLAWPWVSFALISWTAKLEKNFAGAILVAGYTLVDVLLGAWLFRWHIAGATQWTFLLLGGLMAGIYNLLACDWIAEKLVN